MAGSDPIVVCVGYPALQAPPLLDRLRAVDPRIEVVTLPVDPDTDWVRVSPAEPNEEPPPWATGCADVRREALARAEVMIALHAPRDLPSLAPNLRWLQGVGAGVEQFARAGVTRDRVVVTNASGLSAGSMAEFVIGRLLQVWKRFREIETHQEGRAYVQTYGRTFAGTVVGIVGLGAIGEAVAVRAGALGARVLGLKRSYEPGDTSEVAEELFGPDQLHALLSRCEVAVIAAPDTPETHHMIDAKALGAMPRGGVLVNVARGPLVHEGALVEALHGGQLSAAVLDVFEQEPLPADSPLWDAPGCYISAHSSVAVDRYMDDLFDFFEANLVRYVRNEPLRNRIDMAALGFG